jgi:hypothetical protein
MKKKNRKLNCKFRNKPLTLQHRLGRIQKRNKKNKQKLNHLNHLKTFSRTSQTFLFKLLLLRTFMKFCHGQEVHEGAQEEKKKR